MTKQHSKVGFQGANLRAYFEHGFNQFHLDILIEKCHFKKLRSLLKTEPFRLNGNFSLLKWQMINFSLLFHCISRVS